MNQVSLDLCQIANLLEYCKNSFDLFSKHFNFINIHLSECTVKTDCPAERHICYEGTCYVGKNWANILNKTWININAVWSSFNEFRIQQQYNFSSFTHDLGATHWRLTNTGQYCPDTIEKGYKENLNDCKGYCKASGAARLTYFPSEINHPTKFYCRCCSQSGGPLKSTSNDVEVYTLTGFSIKSF